MAKIEKDYPITDLEEDWEGHSGGQVQEFIKRKMTSTDADVKRLQDGLEQRFDVEDYIEKKDCVIVGFMRPTGIENQQSGYHRTGYIDISGVTHITAKIYVKSKSVSPVVFFDKDYGWISGVTATTEQAASVTTYEVDVPNGAEYAVFSCEDKEQTFKVDVNIYKSIVDRFEELMKLDVCYISTDGDDTNDGSKEAPIKTFEKAKKLLSKNGTLVFLAGDYENYTIDLSYFDKILGIGNVRMMYYSQKITSASRVDGYTKVYEAAYTANAGVMNSTKYIYQHDVPDEATRIIASERHAIHGDKTHRLPSTRMYLASSIDEIEQSDKYMWYVDGQKIYFSVANDDLSAHPVIVPYLASGYISVSSVKDIEVKNIKFVYRCLDLSGVSGVFENVVVGMARKTQAGFACNYCKALVLRNCEAMAVHADAAGDGINTHNTDTSINDHSSITMYNCWSHDNSDDGESCHENCSTVHYGGLFEYNGNGVTPAVGGTTSCFNTHVRNCHAHEWTEDDLGSGFSAQGNSEAHANLSCYGCIAEGCNVGYNSTEQYGAIAINCISKGNADSFHSVQKYNCAILQPES